MINKIKKTLIFILSLSLFFSFSYIEPVSAKPTNKTTKTPIKQTDKKKSSKKNKTTNSKNSKNKKTKKSKNKKSNTIKQQTTQKNTAQTTLGNIPLQQVMRANMGTSLNEVFSNPIQARVYQVNQDGETWLLQHKNPKTATNAIKTLNPSLISNFIFFEKNALPNSETQETIQEIRANILQKNPKAYFEVVLDINNYKDSNELTSHMRNIAQKIDFDAFFIQGLADNSGKNPELAFSAITEAKAQNRLIGTNINDNIPSGMFKVDYVYMSIGSDSNEITNKINRLKTNFNKENPHKVKLPMPIIATTQNDLNNSAYNNKEKNNFVTDQTPADRRKLLLALSKQQEDLGISIAYPLFFPLYEKEVVYDALRDEFMYDTLKRIIKTKNEHQPTLLTKSVLD